MPSARRAGRRGSPWRRPELWALLLGWRRPLQRIPEERFFDACYVAPWGPEYCIDAMLEHAAMHPMRHSYQLRRLMAA